MEPTRLHLGELVPTEDGSFTLRHAKHGECYHSDFGARAEARSLYIERSGITQRFAASPAATAVLDVGLGLGYNALETLTAWRAATQPGDLALTSLEVDAALVAALASGEAPWQSNWSPTDLALVGALRRDADGPDWRAALEHPSSGAVARWHVVVGDAAALDLTALTVQRPSPRPFDYVWQDAFSPAKSPTLWTESWFRGVRAASAPDATLMTYSVARPVRDALAASGWSFAKIDTPIRRKRHWLKASAAAPSGTTGA